MNQEVCTAARRVASRFARVRVAGIERGRIAAATLLLASLLPAALAAGVVEARHGDAREGARNAPGSGSAALELVVAASRLDGRPMSLDEAVDAAQRRYNARVVRAEVEDRGGRRVYVLRLLSSDGRVFNVRVDAASGSMQ